MSEARCRCGCGQMGTYIVEGIDLDGRPYHEPACGPARDYLAEASAELGHDFTSRRLVPLRRPKRTERK